MRPGDLVRPSSDPTYPCCISTQARQRTRITAAATRFCPARGMFLNYNTNRPAACHRPPLPVMHHSRLRCLPLHRLKPNVINNVKFFVDMISNTYLAIVHSMCDQTIRHEIVVARSGGFSEIVVARSGGL